MSGLSDLQYPDRTRLPENEYLDNKLRDMKLMFPGKKFRIGERDGQKFVEVVLDW